MCVKYESCRTSTFYMVALQRLSIFHFYVYKSMGASSTSASSTGSTPTTIYILRITSLFRIVQVSIFRY